MPTCDSIEAFSAQVTTADYVDNCRSHLESMQNITCLLTLEGEHSKQEKFLLRMMAWHLGNLATDFAHVQQLSNSNAA
jgi:hypothetical protein